MDRYGAICIALNPGPERPVGLGIQFPDIGHLSYRFFDVLREALRFWNPAR
jgi:hypothetical protein